MIFDNKWAFFLVSIFVPLSIVKIKNYAVDCDMNLVQERILVTEHGIYIGLHNGEQVIRFDSKNYKLIKLIETENQLEYRFENDVVLVLEKKKNLFVLHIFTMSNKSIHKIINPVIIQNFKPIGFHGISDDFDKMNNYFIQ
jgi:hypothetical protein